MCVFLNAHTRILNSKIHCYFLINHDKTYCYLNFDFIPQSGVTLVTGTLLGSQRK